MQPQLKQASTKGSEKMLQEKRISGMLTNIVCFATEYIAVDEALHF